MFKIKLLILLLISFLTFSCTNDYITHSNHKYSLAYIGGEFDGLLLKNKLKNSLQNLNIYDENSIYEIRAGISHSKDLFITNIDNTSDRESIHTTMSIKIVNLLNDCEIYTNEASISQFYIYASGDKFLSNQEAVKKIKRDNTEALIRKLVNKVKNIDNNCDQEKKSNITN